MTRAAGIHARLRAFPVASYDTITGGGPVLVVAPHPDDESLGCGGLIARACRLGRDLAVAVVTDGTGSHPRSRLYPAPRLRALREDEARAAVAALGLAAVARPTKQSRDRRRPDVPAQPLHSDAHRLSHGSARG